eukprot:UN06591
MQLEGQRDKGRDRYLYIIEHMNELKNVRLDIDAGRQSRLFEILFTICDYKLLHATFNCDYLMRCEADDIDKRSSRWLLKALRMGNKGLIDFLYEQGFS